MSEDTQIDSKEQKHLSVGHQDVEQLAYPLDVNSAGIINRLMGAFKWSRSNTKNTVKVWAFKLTDDATSFALGDNFFSFHIPEELDGAQLIAAHAAVTTVSAASGPILIQLASGANDILSTRIGIDDGEKTSYTAAAQPVINFTFAQMTKGDQIDIDIDDIGDGAAQGLQLFLTFQ